MKKLNLKILGGILLITVIAVLVAVIYYLNQSKDPYHIKALVFKTPKSAVDDDFKFNAEIITPRDGKKTHPVIIISHGYNSSMENCEDMAKAYADIGYAALIFDFVGGSRYSSTEVHSSQMTTFTQIKDYEIVLEYVKNNPAFDQDNVFVSGQSFGGLIATAVAAKHPDEINAVILFYPAYNMVENSAKILAAGPIAKKEGTVDDSSIASGNLYDWDGLLVSETYLSELHAMDIIGTIKSIKNDVIILQGDEDDDVTMESTMSFLPYFQSAQMVTIDDGGHGFSGDQFEQARAAAVKFLQEHVKGKQ